MDFETLVSVCSGASSDRKIACESTLDGEDSLPEKTIHHPEPPQSPPQSFWLSKDAESDWFNQNAFIERKNSGKGNSNSTNLHPNPRFYSNSQRSSTNLTSKSGLLGLPKIDTKSRRSCKPGSTRLFPKGSRSVCKSESGSMIEPSSPKVSCMGRVRSRQDRNRRFMNRRGSQLEDKEKPGKSEKPKTGFFNQVQSFFRFGRKNKSILKSDQQLPVDSPPRRTEITKVRDSTSSEFEPIVPRLSVSDTEPPCLGGIKRFASGRKSDSWVGEVGVHMQ